jgi:hypothetical protein
MAGVVTMLAEMVLGNTSAIEGPSASRSGSAPDDLVARALDQEAAFRTGTDGDPYLQGRAVTACAMCAVEDESIAERLVFATLDRVGEG